MTDGSEEAWQLGRKAGLDEVAADANPYAAGSDLAADWADGWREGVKTVNHLVGGGDAWAEWRAAADKGEPDHADAP